MRRAKLWLAQSGQFQSPAAAPKAPQPWWLHTDKHVALVAGAVRALPVACSSARDKRLSRGSCMPVALHASHGPFHLTLEHTARAWPQPLARYTSTANPWSSAQPAHTTGLPTLGLCRCNLRQKMPCVSCRRGGGRRLPNKQQIASNTLQNAHIMIQLQASHTRARRTGLHVAVSVVAAHAVARGTRAAAAAAWLAPVIVRRVLLRLSRRLARALGIARGLRRLCATATTRFGV